MFLMSGIAGDHVGGEWPSGVISVSLGVGVDELASEGRKEERGHLLEQGGDHMCDGFMRV